MPSIQSVHHGKSWFLWDEVLNQLKAMRGPTCKGSELASPPRRAKNSRSLTETTAKGGLSTPSCQDANESVNQLEAQAEQRLLRNPPQTTDDLMNTLANFAPRAIARLRS